MVIPDIILVAFVVLFPAVVAEVAQRNRIAGMIGPVVLCYAIGLAIGNISAIEVNGDLAEEVAFGVVPLAIALLLFSTDFVGWLKYAKRTILSFALAVVSVAVCSFVVSIFFKDQIADIWKLTGMMIGVYTGGTPNMSAIGVALEAEPHIFPMLNAYDLMLSGIYLLLLMTVAQRLALKFLPSFKRDDATDVYETFHYQQITGYDTERIVKKIEARKERKQKRFQVKTLRKLVIARSFGFAFLLALSVVAASIGIAFLITGKLDIPIALMSITTLSIGASFFNKIRRLPKTYEFGEYFLLIFCIAIGMKADFSNLIDLNVFYFCASVFVSSIALHFLLAAIFRIDADTVLITSTAGIFGPAFIGPVASVLKNKEIVVSGLTTGLVGYAVANFLGYGIAHLFHNYFY